MVGVYCTYMCMPHTRCGNSSARVFVVLRPLDCDWFVLLAACEYMQKFELACFLSCCAHMLAEWFVLLARCTSIAFPFPGGPFPPRALLEAGWRGPTAAGAGTLKAEKLELDQIVFGGIRIILIDFVFGI